MQSLKKYLKIVSILAPLLLTNHVFPQSDLEKKLNIREPLIESEINSTETNHPNNYFKQFYITKIDNTKIKMNLKQKFKEKKLSFEKFDYVPFTSEFYMAKIDNTGVSIDKKYSF